MFYLCCFCDPNYSFLRFFPISQTKLDTFMKYDVKSEQVSMAFQNGAMHGSFSSMDSTPFIHTPIQSRQNSGASLLDTLDLGVRKTSMTPSLYSELEFYARRGAGPRRNTCGTVSNTEDEEEEDIGDLPNMENRLALDITDACFSMDLSDECPCLRDINIKVPMGKACIPGFVYFSSLEKQFYMIRSIWSGLLKNFAWCTIPNL